MNPVLGEISKMGKTDPFHAKIPFDSSLGKTWMYSLHRLEEAGLTTLDRLPFTIKIFLENALRTCDEKIVKTDDVLALARWNPKNREDKEIPFSPVRILLQDLTGVPFIADLAALRSAIKKMGGNPNQINPLIPVDLVIDHSVQVDFFNKPDSFQRNVDMEYERNGERYAFLRWAQKAFRNFRVVPPGTGICHQVNLEYLAHVVFTQTVQGELIVMPDTLVGADSHTTMINGLGVLGWGVGGIEAEACMLGYPLSMPLPEVIGFRLAGRLPEGVTATDLVLTVTQLLRAKGVVGKFVEFFGPGLSALSVADRATISNMSPEYGATAGFFPVDEETLRYLRMTNRDPQLIQLVADYSKKQELFRSDELPEPDYSEIISLDLKEVEPCLAGPKRPQDRIPIRQVKTTVSEYLNAKHKTDVPVNGEPTTLSDGSVVIAAITSCTNTSNPSVMVAAGLLAKKAVEHGLTVNPSVKTSLAPGSRVVTDYLQQAGLLTFLDQLGFNLVGYGCTTCIGNSGPLLPPIEEAIIKNNLNVVAILSGNRNFEGRIHPLTKYSFLTSPPLVVAYALAGTVNINLAEEPLGVNSQGKPVYLREIWPSQQEISNAVEKTLTPEMFKARYAKIFDGTEQWHHLSIPEGELYHWNPNSTYIEEPPFFQNFSLKPEAVHDIKDARALAVLGDSITTDHISPAGSIPTASPAGKYLIEHGVPAKEFNSYGARRGNHEVMIRGTFANIRLKNLMTPGTEGGWTIYIPTGEKMSIFDAAMQYQKNGIPLIVIAGKEYGSGSSRDWAAKGTLLLGVKAVIAENFERIHRSNLVDMGVLPLEFKPGQNRETLRLTGFETYDIDMKHLKPKSLLTVTAQRPDYSQFSFEVICRLNSAIEIEYFQNGGILPAVLRKMLTVT